VDVGSGAEALEDAPDVLDADQISPDLEGGPVCRRRG
jgi:hypothetical protein